MEEKKVLPQRPTNPNFNSNVRREIPRPPVRNIPKPPQRPDVKPQVAPQKVEEEKKEEKIVATKVETVKKPPVATKVEAVKKAPVVPKKKEKKQREKLSDQSKGILYGLLGGMFVALAVVFFVFMIINI